MKTVMEYKGFKAEIMEAERLKGEREHELPPGSSLPIYSVYEFKKHPDNWMEEDGCFVVPVKPNKGIWFDWRDNDGLNTAIIPTVKGCNPITGLKTEGFALERYKKKCPKHETEFKADRYCEECGYKWPVQNYISSPNVLWIDGFREKDGITRQFFITEDMMRDIAGHKIGKENTVPAFGFAFYQTKVNKNITWTYSPTMQWFPPAHHFGCTCSGCYIPSIYNSGWGSGNIGQSNIFLTNTSTQLFSSMKDNSGSRSNYSSDEIKILSKSEHFNKMKSLKSNGEMQLDSLNMTSELKSNDDILRSIKPLVKKEVAVGAGAKIKQSLLPDIYDITDWTEEPSSIMRIYFIFEEELNHWKSFGMKDLEGKKDGMLNGLPVG